MTPESMADQVHRQTEDELMAHTIRAVQTHIFWQRKRQLTWPETLTNSHA